MKEHPFSKKKLKASLSRYEHYFFHHISGFKLIIFMVILCEMSFINITGIYLVSRSTQELESNQREIPKLTFPRFSRFPDILDQSSISFPGFTKNQGQINDSDLFYYFTQDNYMIGFYESRIQVYARQNTCDTWENLTITFPRASASVPRGLMQLTTKTNFLIHQLSITDITHWAEIHYVSLYEGITMRFYAEGQILKYEFLISPGADPMNIELSLHQSALITTNITSDHIYCTSALRSNLILWEDQSPMAIQAEKSEIAVSFRPIENVVGCYGFTVGEYDPSKILVIDPVILIWSTYLGERSYDYGEHIIVDATGCAYIISTTYSSSFPIVRAYDGTYNGNMDIVVTKFAADGQSLIYSTYLGGSDSDRVFGIALDLDGCIYITGDTHSVDFPTVNAYNPNHIGGFGFTDAFVTKLAATGRSLIYSTLLGGSDIDSGIGIKVNNDGCAIVTGYTNSTDFPTVDAYNSTYIGGTFDIFVTKFTADGQSLVYSTFFGGSGYDSPRGISLDIENNIYIMGSTKSTDFPTVNAYDSTINGDYDIFITKFTADGQLLLYSSFLGGTGNEHSSSLEIDFEGCVYLTGLTNSTDFPTINAFDSTFNGEYDVFITKFAPDGLSLMYSTFLGGSLKEYGIGIAIDPEKCVYIIGYTNSTDFPTNNAFDSTFNGEYDVFITKLATDGQSLTYSTYLGGEAWDIGTGIALDAFGSAYTTGHTWHSGFPIVNAFDSSFNGDADIFMAKLDLDLDIDQIPDGWENYYGLNANNTEDASLDYDGDGLTNYEEFLHHSSPRKPDSDGDAWNDKIDPNPTNAILPNIPVIGGSTFLLIGLAIVFFLREHKRRPQKFVHPPEEPKESALKE